MGCSNEFDLSGRHGDYWQLRHTHPMSNPTTRKIVNDSMSSHRLMNQFIISYLSGLCRHAPSVALKHLGMAYVSLFLILFKILMTRHLQLSAGQIQCFLTYILFHYFGYCAGEAFEISNSIPNSHDSASTASQQADTMLSNLCPVPKWVALFCVWRMQSLRNF